jgi:hypothetical protein
MAAISSRGVVISGTRGTGVMVGAGSAVMFSTSPLNSVRSSILKMGLIPKSEGKAMTYRTQFLGDLERACSACM